MSNLEFSALMIALFSLATTILSSRYLISSWRNRDATAQRVIFFTLILGWMLYSLYDVVVYTSVSLPGPTPEFLELFVLLKVPVSLMIALSFVLLFYSEGGKNA